jgi:thymidylate synthase (FAD)
MRFVEPKVVHLAGTRLDVRGTEEFLKEVRARGKEQSESDWSTDSESDAETLIEMAGRLCYRSWKPGLNPNVTKVTEGNQKYIGNILNQKHGSVLEHAYDTYAFLNVSRVFTHELVRHRLCNFSQESLRYVRLTDLGAYWPDAFESLPEGRRAVIRNRFEKVFNDLEQAQRELAAILELDKGSLADKKKLTSSMRRLAPIGLATNIIATANHRNWRWLIQLRTSRYAEEEIRKVFAEVYRQQSVYYPAIYQDALVEVVDGIAEVSFQNAKV